MTSKNGYRTPTPLGLPIPDEEQTENQEDGRQDR